MLSSSVLHAVRMAPLRIAAKSVLCVLGACVKCGDELEFKCEGPDEEEAMSAMVEAIEGGLGD